MFIGNLIAAEYVETDWALSFMVPGIIMGVIGFLVFSFLVVNPRDVGCTPPKNQVCTSFCIHCFTLFICSFN